VAWAVPAKSARSSGCVDAVSGAALVLAPDVVDVVSSPRAAEPRARLVADLVPPRCIVLDRAAARSFAVNGRIGAACNAAPSELGAALCDVETPPAAATFVDPTTGTAMTMHAQKSQLVSRGPTITRRYLHPGSLSPRWVSLRPWPRSD
jgi:hypothetical protein